MPIISTSNEGIKLSVRVQPNASKCEITDVLEDFIKIKLNVPPIEGKANEKCISFLSDILKIPKTSIEIISGEKSRLKIFLIKGKTDIIYKKLKEILGGKI